MCVKKFIQSKKEDCPKMAKIYEDKDVDLAVVKNKTIAFIGYGNQ